VIAVQDGLEVLVRKVLLDRRAVQETLVPLDSQDNPDFRDSPVSLDCLVILASLAIQDSQVGLDFKAPKVTQVSLEWLVYLDHVPLHREETLERLDPPEQRGFRVLQARVVRAAVLVCPVALGRLALLVSIVLVLGNSAIWEFQFPHFWYSDQWSSVSSVGDSRNWEKDDITQHYIEIRAI